MTLLREALHGQPISRRAALQAAGIGALGLAGAALIGCEGENPEELVQKLLTIPMQESDIPAGLIYDHARIDDDEGDKALNIIGKVDVVLEENTTGYNTAITYVVFKDASDMHKSFKEMVKSEPGLIDQELQDPSLPSSTLLFKDSEAEFQYYLCVAAVDNVIVVTYDTREMAIQLARSGISHLEKIR